MNTQSIQHKALGLITAVVIAGALAIPAVAQNRDEGDDPDHGVARLSLLNGEVSVQRGDNGDVVAAERNAPLLEGDHLLTGAGSRAEVQFDSADMIRLGASSDVKMGELKNGNILVQVDDGTATFRVLRDFKTNIEISTPTVSVRPTQEGTYRITVQNDGSTEVTVRGGEAEIFSPKGSEILHSGKTLEARGTAADPEYMIVAGLPLDDFDRWNNDRDRDLSRSQSYRYTSRYIPGADDLDGYGRWVYDSPYGWVWVPNTTSTWAPYRVGRWTYADYYGWTWLSGDPWGWAPYHYGRWYSSPYGWAWYPGEIGIRPYYRPALVGFFGWGGGGLDIGVGFGFANVGWVPLAPYEIYRPWYGRGFGGGRNVTIVNNINIGNTYRNARLFNGREGITSIRAENFGHGRVSGENFVRGSSADFARAGRVDGGLPFNHGQEAHRFSDRAPAADLTARATQRGNRDFFTRAGVVHDNGHSFGGGERGVAGQTATLTRPVVSQGNSTNRSEANHGNGERGNGDRAVVQRNNGSTVTRGNDRATIDHGNDRGSGSRATASASPGNTGTGNSGGWRRFDPSTVNASTAGNESRGGGSRGARSTAGNATGGSVTRPETASRSYSRSTNEGFSGSITRPQATQSAPRGYSAPREQRTYRSPNVDARPASPRNESRTYSTPRSESRTYSSGGSSSRSSGGSSHSGGGGGSSHSSGGGHSGGGGHHR